MKTLNVGPTKRYTLLPIAILLASMASGYASVLVSSSTDGLSLFLAAGLFLIVLFPIALRIIAKSFDIFEPICFLGVLYLLYFGIRSIVIILSPEMIISPHLRSTDLNLVYPLLLVLLGYMCFLIGYYSPIPLLLATRMPKFRERWGKNRVAIIIFSLVLVGFLFTGINAIRGRFYGSVSLPQLSLVSPFQQIIDIVANFYNYALVLVAILFFAHPKRGLGMFSLVSILWIISISLSLLSGSKQLILYSLLYVFVPYHYLRRRMSLLKIGIFLVIILLTFPTVSLYYSIRHQHSRIYFEPSSAIGDLKELFQGLFSMTGYELMSSTAKTFVGRFHGIDSLMLILQDPHVRGDISNRYSLRLIPIYWIPRIFWPDKPIIDLQLWFAHEYWGYPSSGYILIPSMQLGEFYLNGGILGVAMGMLILGIVARFLYVYFIKQGGQVGIFLYVFSMIFLMRSLEAVTVTNVTGFVQEMVVVFVIARLLNRGPILFKRSRRMVQVESLS